MGGVQPQWAGKGGNASKNQILRAITIQQSTGKCLSEGHVRGWGIKPSIHTHTRGLGIRVLGGLGIINNKGLGNGKGREGYKVNCN